MLTNKFSSASSLLTGIFLLSWVRCFHRVFEDLDLDLYFIHDRFSVDRTQSNSAGVE